MEESSRRHWGVLRDALLSSGPNKLNKTTTSSAATDFFPLYPKAPVSPKAKAQNNYTWMAYDLSRCQEESTIIYAHEKSKEVKRVAMAELLSHKVNMGVDNTGNIRTWPSEQILLSYVLSSNVCSQVQRRGAQNETLPISCCEMGSGMVGLASLGLLACVPVDLERVVMTDGNPLCVQNLQVCVNENKTRRAFSPRVQHTNVMVELLRWDRNATVRDDWHHQFDLVLASDCLFFEEFHEDLAYSIKNLLRRGSGRCLLLQPSRNGSMERFCIVAERYGFVVHVSRDYDPQIVHKHEVNLQTRSDYVPDVHFPVLLTLTIG